MRARSKRTASIGVDKILNDDNYDDGDEAAGAGGSKKKRRLSEEARQRHRECNRLVAQRARAKIKHDLESLRTENGALSVEIDLLRQVSFNTLKKKSSRPFSPLPKQPQALASQRPPQAVMTALEADIAREKAAFRAAAAAAAEAEEAAAQAAARGTTTHTSRARTAAERNHGQAVVSDSSSESSSGVPADPYPDQVRIFCVGRRVY